MLGNIHPEGFDILPGIKNKYLDISVNDEIYEIKTTKLLVEFNSPGFNEVLINDINFKLKNIVKHEMESKARYAIFNSIIFYYIPDENQIKSSKFASLFWKNSGNLKRKWLWSSNIFNVRVQDLFVYDLLKKEIVYINKDSYLFKKTPVDVYNVNFEDGKYKYGNGFAINLHTKFTEEYLRDRIRV